MSAEIAQWVVKVTVCSGLPVQLLGIAEFNYPHLYQLSL